MGTELMIAADSFRSPNIDRLIDTAASYLKEELEDLRKASPQIQAIESAVEQGHFDKRRQNLDRRVGEWLWMLKDAVDTLDDILDEIEYNRLLGEEEKKVSTSASASPFKKIIIKFFKRSSTPESDPDPALARLREAVKSLGAIAASLWDFSQLVQLLRLTIGLTGEQPDQLTRTVRDALTHQLVPEEELLRAGKVNQKMINMLIQSDGNTNVSVVSIVGSCGVWKTILAQLVYKHERIKEKFPTMMWISVSGNFDVALLLRGVIACIPNANPPPLADAPLASLQEYLQRELVGKKYLLVLDDVWLDEDTREWEKFVTSLVHSEWGSKIVLTTRMDSTAKLIGRVIDIDEQLWSLMWWKGAEGRVLERNLINFLQSWLQYDHNQGSNEDIINLGYGDNQVVQLLMLSYQHLSATLQKCFRFCSIYPRGYVFHKEELTYIWMALGLLQPSQYKHQSLVDIGGYYFDFLLRKSFFAPYAEDIVGKYIMNNLMYDLAKSVSEDECWRVDDDNPEKIPGTIDHLYIICRRSAILRRVPYLKNLRTLYVDFGQENDNPSLEHGQRDADSDLEHAFDELLGRLTSIRVLILSHYPRHELPSKIGDLLHLRLLRLQKTEIHLWPNSLSKLHNLKVICKDRRHQRP